MHWYVANRETNETVPAIFFFSNIFWIIYFQLFSCKMRFQNSSNYCNKKWMTHYQKKRGHDFVQQSVRNVCAKFEVDRWSRFRTRARHAYHPETFPSRNFSNHENCNIKFPLNTFPDQIIICQASFGNLWHQTNLFSWEKVNIWSL